MDYLPIETHTHRPPVVSKHSSESRYWRQFKHPVFFKDYAPVTAIHFSPSKPHRFAVTAATRIQIYTPRTQKVVKTISRFKDVARSGNIRADGKLLVAADDTGLIQVFDLGSRAILRTLDAHKQPVHVAKFSTLLPTQVLSCSDDTTAKVWDIPSQTVISTFSSHSDYVRAGQVSSLNPNIVLTGSYDGTMRLSDIRTGQCELLMEGNRKNGLDMPVEQVLMFPSGTVAISASASIIRIWDIVAGGRCMRALSNHQKTVTSLSFDSNASRLLTAGLDHMVKVYDTSNYKVVHTIRYPAPILCIAISPDETHLAAGMTDGTLSIRRRQIKSANDPSEQPFSSENFQAGTFESFLGVEGSKIGQGTVKKWGMPVPIADVNELRIERKREKRLKDYDKLLKKFRYSVALDSVLKKGIPPTTIFSLIQELIHRDGLKIALAGRDDILLEPVLRMLLKYVADPRFGRLVCDVTGLLIDLYMPVLGQSPTIDALLVRLSKKVAAEINFQKRLKRTKGALDMIFSSVALSVATKP